MGKEPSFSREFKRDAVQLITEKRIPVGKFVGKYRVTAKGAEIKGLIKRLFILLWAPVPSCRMTPLTINKGTSF